AVDVREVREHVFRELAYDAEKAQIPRPRRRRLECTAQIFAIVRRDRTDRHARHAVTELAHDGVVQAARSYRMLGRPWRPTTSACSAPVPPDMRPRCARTISANASRSSSEDKWAAQASTAARSRRRPCGISRT